MIVVYTVITNNYDDLKQVITDKEVRYVCFTDNMNIEANGWELRKADKHNRYYKFHSHLLFPQTDYTIYIDAHGTLIKTPQFLVEELKGLAIGQQPHPTRKCLYDEARAVEGMVDRSILQKLMYSYKLVGFPVNYGLFCNGCIIRANHPVSKLWNEKSWEYFERSGIKRDQLITQYVKWSKGISIKPMTMFEWGGHK